MPVNIVFVGYQPKSIDVDRILDQLPAHGDPTVRADPDFGIPGTPQDVGLRYDYKYNSRFAGSAFDDAFFAYLGSIAGEGPISYYQQLYNEQQHNNLVVGPQSAYIDADATEAWLEGQSTARLGIPASQYTVFLVNWYGRADFQFHAYYHRGVVDPDTGVDYGLFDESLTRSWGGHSGRTWFYDLSAGPDWDSDSWDVDDGDWSGDGVVEYRIPPIWEYGRTDAYRPFTDLSGDLAKVIRYVAIDMLFTTSPIYDPAATVPGPDGGKAIQVDVFEGNPSSSGIGHIHADTIGSASQGLEPYYDVGASATDQPLAGSVLDAYNIATGISHDPGCSDFTTLGPLGVPEVELACYFNDHRAQYFPASPGTAVIPDADFTVPQYGFPWIGSTDPDFHTGLPDYITQLDVAPPAGYVQRVPPTPVAMHEAGHFVGLQHPFDGWDSSKGVYIWPNDAYAFAWDGDETATPMSYLYGQGSLTFSWFDRDNLARWYVGRLLDLADTDAAAILARPHGAQADSLLAAADAEFGHAVAAMQPGDWNAAATAAVAGYRDVQRADAASGVTPASDRLAELDGGVPRHPDQGQQGSGHALTPRVLHSTLTGKGPTPILAPSSTDSPE